MSIFNNLNTFFDHTLLSVDATKEDILSLISEAKEYKFTSVCIQPFYVSLCSKELQGSNVKVCTVIDFPFGSSLTDLKIMQAKKTLNDGADELDMVMNIAAFKNKQFDLVLNEIKEVKNITKNKILKVIIESSLLDENEIKKACELALKANVDFVKTSTGFAKGGASVKDIEIIKHAVGDSALIKASGGIRDLKFTKDLISAGASRIGSSSCVKIFKEYNNAINV